MAIYKELITDDHRIECDVVWPNKYVANLFLFYMIVLVGACALTGLIAYCRIRRNLARVQQLCENQQPDMNVDQKSLDSLAEQVLQISNLICILTTVFVFCTFPFPLFVVLVESGVLVNYRYNYVIYLATSCLLYGNSLANPLLLMFMSRDARIALVDYRSPARRIDAAEHIGMEDV